MDNPYVTLGVPPTASAAQIRGAYHTLVKRYHPDVIADPAKRETASNTLVKINLAYEKALHAAVSGESGEYIPDASRVAATLLDRGQHEAALNILSRAVDHDAQWHALRGRALHALHQYQPAHASYRAAIKLDPGNAEYRQGALAAAVASRREKVTPAGRFWDWLKGLFLKR